MVKRSPVAVIAFNYVAYGLCIIVCWAIHVLKNIYINFAAGIYFLTTL